ncbi:dTDP-4-dehydrorhamnose 3,5-epimerase family protein [Cellulomonas persica]|uniref:dTDP-4-dehydrorhamnose 3,5-epimerase RmlC n=1 Tax=Cellulomonas persica TaxID=76861 RepID=A0A510UXQ4_9CELL|nr:dTDP-4-dehydrorhamnose 3,5-epimerase [Cellulomonas persica]GEK19462.1 DTDP-4-dehydrorhamnose 3,5-epimerase RmlC [Cellulomonas persica]
MSWEPLAVEGAYRVTQRVFGDSRGSFLEWFRAAELEELTGRRFDLRQANLSVSAAGVLRGVHFADVPPGQAKYVTCVNGAVLDVVVDLRVGSPTFGAWDSVLLDDESREAVFLSEGLGHAFLSLQDGSVVTYLCSAPYAPAGEHGINPLDPALGITWPTHGRNGAPLSVLLSDKDRDAPSLAEALETNLLPRHDDVRSFIATL